MSKFKQLEEIMNKLKRSTGPPIIQEVDQYLIGDHIKQLVVSILKENKIGEGYFKQKCDEYFRKQGIRSTRKRSGQIYNYIQMLKKDKRVTWKKFTSMLLYLDFELEEVTIKIKVDGETQVHTIK